MGENDAVIILFTRFKPAAYGGGSVTCGRPTAVLGAVGGCTEDLKVSHTSQAPAPKGRGARDHRSIRLAGPRRVGAGQAGWWTCSPCIVSTKGVDAV